MEIWKSELARLLSDWGIGSLRPLQEHVITRILEAAQAGSDTPRRRIVVLPTGYGKTLCFSAPAALLPGPTIVVYPLRALMADQERRFADAGLDPVTLIGGLGATELRARLHRIRAGSTKLVIANPEILASPPAARCLADWRPAHMVIDEAHVLPAWGNSFRPAYQDLAASITHLRPVQISAFTGTADTATREALQNFLGGTGIDLIDTSINRPEIQYAVMRCPGSEPAIRAAIGDLIRSQRLPAIVFVRNRVWCERYSLTWRTQLPTAAAKLRFYHAGLSRAERFSIEHWFLHSHDGILISTNAYGMGLDKPDIRTVIHIGVPGDAAAYLQETGRAARDGTPAKAIALIDPAGPVPSDPHMAAFLDGRMCRRAALLRAVGENLEENCGNCDICRTDAREPGAVERLRDWVASQPGQLTLKEAGYMLKNNPGWSAWGRIELETLVRLCIADRSLRTSRSPLSWGRLVPGRPSLSRRAPGRPSGSD